MKSTLTSVLLGMLMCTTASAQLSIGHFAQMNVNAGLTQTMNAAVLAAAKRAPPDASASDSGGTAYRTRNATSRKVKKALVAIVRKANPDAAKQLSGILKSKDVIAMFSRDMAPYRLKAGNVSDAITAYLVANWMIANRADDPAPAHVQAVRTNINHSMGPALAKLNNEQRQFLSELLIYQTMFAIGARTAARSDPGAMKKLANDSHQNMIATGVNLRKMDLTDAGLVKR